MFQAIDPELSNAVVHTPSPPTAEFHQPEPPQPVEIGIQAAKGILKIYLLSDYGNGNPHFLSR